MRWRPPRPAPASPGDRDAGLSPLHTRGGGVADAVRTGAGAAAGRVAGVIGSGATAAVSSVGSLVSTGAGAAADVVSAVATTVSSASSSPEDAAQSAPPAMAAIASGPTAHRAELRLRGVCTTRAGAGSEIGSGSRWIVVVVWYACGSAPVVIAGPPKSVGTYLGAFFMVSSPVCCWIGDSTVPVMPGFALSRFREVRPD
jgi:hypothetical protein